MATGDLEERVQFRVQGTSVTVSGLLVRPALARALYVLAHGAGAGMNHAFNVAIVGRLAAAGIASLRYQFPYMEAGRKRPDPPHLLEATVRSAVGVAGERAEGVPLFAGGKSMGGRMTSGAAAKEELPGLRGLIFLGFPLHLPGRPGIERASHLRDVGLPMLFLQGTRDPFAQLDLLRPVCERLGPRSRLHVVEGGDHSFKVLKRSGRTEAEVMDELANTVSGWINDALGMPRP